MFPKPVMHSLRTGLFGNESNCFFFDQPMDFGFRIEEGITNPIGTIIDTPSSRWELKSGRTNPRFYCGGYFDDSSMMALGTAVMDFWKTRSRDEG